MKKTELTLTEAGMTWAKLGWAGVVATTMYTSGVATVIAESAQDHADANQDGLVNKALIRTTGEIADSAKSLGRTHMSSLKETVSFSDRKSKTAKDSEDTSSN